MWDGITQLFLANTMFQYSKAILQEPLDLVPPKFLTYATAVVLSK